MEITVFGLGYVGCVSAACLARDGHRVTGVDVDESKVETILAGKSPIIEPGLDGLIRDGRQNGRLEACTQVDTLGEVVIVCVGTPCNENGSLGLKQIRRVTEQIGGLIRTSTRCPVINFRSTLLPGIVEEILIPILEDRSGKLVGVDFGVCLNPEFNRETTAVVDYYHPPFTVIGEFNSFSGDKVARMYEGLDAPVRRVPIKVAEMIKYGCNAFHAMKITFANEIGNFCKQQGIDSHEVMEIMCQDTKLNLSPYYMKPGFAFGGSCLPKDLRALVYQAKRMDLEMPLMESLLVSNQKQIDRAFQIIRKSGRKRIGVLGISFKAGTDDLRESPIVVLIEMLLGKGYQVMVYDREVSLSKLFGANRRYIDKVIPHISTLMKETVQEVTRGSDLVIVSKNNKVFVDAVAKIGDETLVLDLVRVIKDLTLKPLQYEGLCW